MQIIVSNQIGHNYETKFILEKNKIYYQCPFFFNIKVMLTCALKTHIKDFINGKYLLQILNFQSLEE